MVSTSRRRASNVEIDEANCFFGASRSIPSPPITADRAAAVRRCAARPKKPVEVRSEPFRPSFRLEWFVAQCATAQFAAKARQIWVTAGEQHLEVGPGAARA